MPCTPRTYQACTLAPSTAPHHSTDGSRRLTPTPNPNPNPTPNPNCRPSTRCTPPTRPRSKRVYPACSPPPQRAPPPPPRHTAARAHSRCALAANRTSR
eukprot:scaffold30238_cov52-Phaeocystis_antarctica.AAC.3